MDGIILRDVSDIMSDPFKYMRAMPPTDNKHKVELLPVLLCQQKLL